jgi:hypothetical protein
MELKITYATVSSMKYSTFPDNDHFCFIVLNVQEEMPLLF